MADEPDNLILRKLNQILGWQRNADKRIDQLVEDMKAIRASFWVNGRDVTRVEELAKDLDVRVSVLEIDKEDAQDKS